MEDKIIELISLLSIETDSELISALYSKLEVLLVEKGKEKDLEYKYSFDKIKVTTGMSTLLMGVRKTVEHEYKSREIDLSDKIWHHLNNHYCDKCELASCDICPIKNRLKLLENIDKKHDKIKADIIKNLSEEFLMNKYLVNKIIVKLNNLKKQTK